MAGHTCKLLVLDPPAPTLAELRAHVAARLDAAPRLRRRLAPTPLGLAPPAWVDDPEFDVARHVRRAPAGPGPLDRRRLGEVVAEAMRERLDRAHPLWSLDLIEGLEDGRAALLWKLHHAMADGTAVMRTVEAVLWDAGASNDAAAAGSGEVAAGTGAAAAVGAAGRDWEPRPAPGAIGLLAAGVRDRAVGAAGGAARAGRAVASPAAWRAAVGEARRLPGAISRDLLPGRDPSPFDAHVSARRAVAFAQASLDDLKRVAHAQPSKATVNDVVLALVAGSLRRWMAERGLAPDELRAQVPVSLHGRYAHPDALANRDSFLCVGLPLGEPDPVARLRAIARDTARRKREHDAETLDVLFEELRHAPRPVSRLASRLAAGPRVFALSVSNVPGPAEPRYVLAARVAELYPLAEVGERHALRVAAVSLAGTMGFGLCADAAAVEGVDELAAGLEVEAAELVSRC